MTDKQAISILLIDDQAIVRAAFKSLLERIPHFKVVGDAPDARGGVELAAKLKPDVAILDITMAGMSGIDAVGPLKKASPQTRVLMASQHEGMKFVQQALCRRRSPTASWRAPFAARRRRRATPVRCRC
jgi:DNA-binding NarL/FixJ family response regulator